MSSDSISRDIIASRAVGQFPLSIASSLALESAVGILPEAPTDRPEIKHRDLLMVNMRTLIRNLYGSMEKEKKAQLTEYTMAETLSNEMRTIEGIVAEHSDGRALCNFYHCSYSDLNSSFPKALIKTPNSNGQVAYAAMEAAILKYLLRDFVSGSPINQYKRAFPDSEARALLMTHYPVDLLQRYRFKSVALLESHTGAIKTPPLWNTKLQGGRDLSNVPFDKMTLQLFGDGVLFSPFPIKVRQRMVELAARGRWTALSSKDLVIQQVVDNRDPALEVLVKDLYRAG